jgi:ABC-type transport system substrate-binding protein
MFFPRFFGLCLLLCGFLMGCTSSLMLPARTLRLALESSPKTLDPAHSTDAFSGQILGLLYSNLMKFDQNGLLVMDAAKHYSIKEEGRRYTFLLRENLHFSNGETLTAEDVSFSFERLASMKEDSPRAWLLNQVAGFEDFRSGKTKKLSGIRILGEHKISIDLKRPFSPFPALLAMPQLAIVNKRFIEEGGTLTEESAGAGPYVLKEWRREQDLLVVRNSKYAKEGNLEAIYFKILKDPLTLMSEFRSRNLHVVEVPPEDIKSLKPTRARIDSINQYNLYFLGLNMKTKALQSRRLRRAMAISIDRGTILKTVLQGQGELSTGPVPRGLPGYLSDGGFSFEPKVALDEIEDAGFQGLELRLLLHSNPRSIRICEVLKQYLEQAGLKIRLVTRDWNAFTSSLVNGDFDLFYRNWIADFPDGDNFLYPLYHSESTGLKGNYPRYAQPLFDECIEASRKEVDSDKRAESLRRCARMAREDASRILLWFKTKNFATYPAVQNFKPFPMYNSNKYLHVNLLTQ